MDHQQPAQSMAVIPSPLPVAAVEAPKEFENEHPGSALAFAHLAPPCSEEHERVLIEMFRKAANNINPDKPVTLNQLAFLMKLARPAPENSSAMRSVALHMAEHIAQARPEHEAQILGLFAELRGDPAVGWAAEKETKEFLRRASPNKRIEVIEAEKIAPGAILALASETRAIATSHHEKIPAALDLLADMLHSPNPSVTEVAESHATTLIALFRDRHAGLHDYSDAFFRNGTAENLHTLAAGLKAAQEREREKESKARASWTPAPL